MARTLTALGILTPGRDSDAHIDARCECTGDCGREHLKSGDGRCHVTDQPAHPLALVAPGHTAAEATRLDRNALVAWCPACCAHATRHPAHQAANHDGPDLLDLLATGGDAA